MNKLIKIFLVLLCAATLAIIALWFYLAVYCSIEPREMTREDVAYAEKYVSEKIGQHVKCTRHWSETYRRNTLADCGSPLLSDTSFYYTMETDDGIEFECIFAYKNKSHPKCQQYYYAVETIEINKGVLNAAREVFPDTDLRVMTPLEGNSNIPSSVYVVLPESYMENKNYTIDDCMEIRDKIFESADLKPNTNRRGYKIYDDFNIIIDRDGKLFEKIDAIDLRKILGRETTFLSGEICDLSKGIDNRYFSTYCTTQTIKHKRTHRDPEYFYIDVCKICLQEQWFYELSDGEMLTSEEWKNYCEDLKLNGK